MYNIFYTGNWVGTSYGQKRKAIQIFKVKSTVLLPTPCAPPALGKYYPSETVYITAAAAAAWAS